MELENMNMFKLDLIELIMNGIREDVDVEGHNVHVGCHSTLTELSRQLHAAGAPDATFEQQQATLLADHAAMRAAEGELPAVDVVAAEMRKRPPGACVAAEVAWDVFRPVVARLTRERDEARANEKATAELFEALSEDHGDAQEANATLRARVAELETIGLAKVKVDALIDQAAEVTRLRQRVADLEESARWSSEAKYTVPPSQEPEPSADMVEHVAAVLENGTWDGAKPWHDMSRAVLRALAAMGVEAFDQAIDLETCATVAHMAYSRPGLPEAERWAYAIRRAFDVARSRLAPVLAAKDARIAELEAGLRKIVAEFQDAPPYVSDYFREKYGYDASIAKAAALVEKVGT